MSKLQSIKTFVLFAVICLSTVSCLTIKRFETTPKPSTTTTKAPPTTTVSPRNPVEKPEAKGPIVVLQHHGTLDGPSGRFEKTEFDSAPPVNLSLPPVFLPEFIPVLENVKDLEMAASNDQSQIAGTANSAASQTDLNRPEVFQPASTAIHEPQQENKAVQEALLFVRG